MFTFHMIEFMIEENTDMNCIKIRLIMFLVLPPGNTCVVDGHWMFDHSCDMTSYSCADVQCVLKSEPGTMFLLLPL